MDEQYFNDKLEKHNEDLSSEVDDLLKKSETEKLSVIDYYTLYENTKILQKKNENKEKIEQYKKIIKEKVLNSSIEHTAEDYCCLSKIFFDEKKYDKCFEYIDKSIRLDSNNADYNFAKGEYYRQLGKHKEAKIEYAKAIHLNPEMEHFIKLMVDSDKLINESKYLRYFIYGILTIGALAIGYILVKMALIAIDFF